MDHRIRNQRNGGGVCGDALRQRIEPAGCDVNRIVTARRLDIDGLEGRARRRAQD